MIKTELEAWLNAWLRQYVGTTAEGPEGISAARPLAEARVAVEDAPGKPGSYRVVLSIKPAYQLEELPMPLQAVFEVPGRGA